MDPAEVDAQVQKLAAARLERTGQEGFKWVLGAIGAFTVTLLIAWLKWKVTAVTVQLAKERGLRELELIDASRAAFDIRKSELEREASDQKKEAERRLAEASTAARDAENAHLEHLLRLAVITKLENWEDLNRLAGVE